MILNLIQGMLLREIIKYGKEHGYHFDKITPGTKMVRQRVNN